MTRTENDHEILSSYRTHDIVISLSMRVMMYKVSDVRRHIISWEKIRLAYQKLIFGIKKLNSAFFWKLLIYLDNLNYL